MTFLLLTLLGILLFVCWWFMVEVLILKLHYRNATIRFFINEAIRVMLHRIRITKEV